MRIAPCIPLLALLLALPGCKPAAAPANTQASAAPPAAASATPAAPATSTPAPTCPDADFTAFLSRFQGDVEVQRTSTADPLTMESIDADAMPEPRRVSKQVPLAEIEFPVVFDVDKRNSEGLQETVTELGPSEREVTHGLPDSDAQIRFNFRAVPCWKLVRVSNDMI